MRVASFYHAFAEGTYETPLREHLSALTRTGFEGPTYFGLVGSLERRAEVRDLLDERLPAHRICAQADEGFEQVTLDAVRAYAIAHPDDAVLYTHTKGAGFPSGWEDAWRRSMTCALFADLENNFQAVQNGYDAVGSHWLTAEQFPGLIPDGGFPMFGGNFWLAKCSYLATLPVCSRQSRHEAEAWIGRGERLPRVLDLQPGWPGVANCVTRIGWPR